MKKKNESKAFRILMAGVITAMLLVGCGSGEKTEAGRLDRIKEKGVLTVATEPYFAPQEFIDPSKSGQEQYVGSDMEMARYMADKLGVKLEIVPLEFGAVISSVAEGKYDLAVSALAYTPARAEAMELSDSYQDSGEEEGYGLLIRTENRENIRNAEDMKEFTIITQSGSLQEAMVNEQIPSVKEFKKVSSMNDAFLAVQEGKADAAAVAVENASLYIDNNPSCGMMIVPDFRFTIAPEYDGMRVGAKKGEIELIGFVNESIREVRESGEYSRWYQEAVEYAAKLGL